MSGPISDHIRSNVWAILACFIAAMGTAVVANASDGPPESTTSASAKKQVKKLKRKLAAIESRLAALEAKPAPTTPAIGTVNGLDIASSTSPDDGINFGADTNLYRENASRLRTDDTFSSGTGAVGSFTGATLSSLGFEAISGGTLVAWLDTAGNLSMDGDLRLDSGRITLFETTDPGTPSPNQAWLYVRETGGISELVIEWNDSTDVISNENVPG